MNSETLLKALKNGATIHEGWKQRSSFSQTARKQIILKHPDGTTEAIQRSCLKPLFKRGLIATTIWVGGRYDYKLKE